MNLIKDLDREILSYIPDEELLTTCSISKRFYYVVCDDAFLKRRLKKFSDVEKYKKENETWKRFFSRLVDHIMLLENFNYKYTSGDFEKQYEIISTTSNERLLLQACLHGELEIAKHAISIGHDVDIALRMSAENGHLHIVKYLVEKENANITYNDYESLRWASLFGRYDVVKYLIEKGADVHAKDDYSLKWAAHHGHFDVVKLLVESGANIRAGNGFAIGTAKLEGHNDVVKFLLEHSK